MHEWVVHREPGQIPGDRRVPLELPFFDQHGDGRRGEHLGIRRNSKPRLSIDSRGLAQLPDTVSPGEHDLPILHDRYGHSGYPEGLENLGHVAIEFGRWRGLQREERWRPECGGDERKRESIRAGSQENLAKDQ